MSQRDVPGITRAVIPLLSRAGVRALSVGVNTYSGPPHVPRIFKWVDRPSNTSLVAMWHPGGYGGITVSDCVIVDGFSHALCPHFIGDNEGPPTADVFTNAVATVRAEFPNATLVSSHDLRGRLCVHFYSSRDSHSNYCVRKLFALNFNTVTMGCPHVCFMHFTAFVCTRNSFC
jgi:hypothetical protein